MKTLRLFGMALMAVLMCVNFASCSNEEVTSSESQKGKEIVVSLGFSGDFEISESPLSRADSDEGNNLYLIEVIDKKTNSDYAYGLFDDISKMKIKMIEDNTYTINASIFKNGKVVLYQSDNVFSEPFPNNTALDNQFIYSAFSGLATRSFKLSDGEIYGIPNLDIFINPTTVEYTAKENTDIVIGMVRQSFGAEFIAENLTEGSLNVYLQATGVDGEAGTTLYSPSFELTQSSPSTNQIFFLPRMATITGQSFMLSATLSVICTWVKDNGDEVELGSPAITFERNKKTTIKIRLAKDVENGFSFTYYEEEDLGDGGTYTVEDGEAIEETTE